MRVALLLLLHAACTDPCRNGTIFLDVTLDSGSAEADVLDFVVAPSQSSGTRLSGRMTHRKGDLSGSVELDFSTSGYPGGLLVLVSIDARLSDETLIGHGGTQLTLSPGCTHTFVLVDAVTPQKPDLAQPMDLSAGPDLSPPGFVARPSGVTADLRAVALGAGGFVAVGTGGAVTTSPDGITWTARPNTISADLRSITWFAPLYATVGTNGFIATSPDGINWTPRTQATAQLNVVRHGTNNFVAAGNAGLIYLSGDGMTWAPVVSGVTEPLFGIAVGNNLAAVGYSGSVTVSATQGAAWTPQNSGTLFQLSCAAYGGLASNKVFVALANAGNLITSADSVNWTFTSTGAGVSMNGLFWDDDRALFWGVGQGGRLLRSGDGSNWTSQDSTTTEALYDVSASDARVVVVGAAGTIVSTR